MRKRSGTMMNMMGMINEEDQTTMRTKKTIKKTSSQRINLRACSS
jgi:hypothetical protein